MESLSQRLRRTLAEATRSPADLLPLLCLGAALALLGYRFTHFDLVPFILDEPHFLHAAGAQLEQGRWMSASPIMGTQGVRYGPSVVWFYGVIQWLFGPSPEVCVLVMCATVTLSHAALALAVGRAFRGGVLVHAALLALVASSPYQFFWSRLAWDQLVNVCTCWVVVLLSWPGPLGWGRRVALGALFGIAFSSHLMVTPLAVLTVALLSCELLRQPKALVATVLPVIAVALAVNLPYILYTYSHPPLQTPIPQPWAWELLLEHLLQPPRVATTWGLQYFFDGAWLHFLNWSGGVRPLLERAWDTLLLVAAVSAVGLLTALRAPEPRQRRLAWLAVITWAGYAAFYTYRTLDRHPHYQFPTWWVVVVGVAGLLVALRRYSAGLGAVAAGAVLVAAGVQWLVNVQWMEYVDRWVGTRGMHYSVPLSHQQRALEQACTRAHAPGAAQVLLRNETLLTPAAVNYVAKTTPACAGVKLWVCQPYNCPPGPYPLLRLHYANSVGGALAVD